MFLEALAFGVQAFLADGRLAEARALVQQAEAVRTSAGVGFLDQARGRLGLAEGNAGEAVDHLARAAEAARGAGYLVDELQSRSLLVEALARSGRNAEAEAELRRVLAEARRSGAGRLLRETLARAAPLGLEVPPEAPAEPSSQDRVVLGERMVTSMFADVRGYTAIAERIPPEELTGRMVKLYGWARAG